MIYSDRDRSFRDILYAEDCVKESKYPNAEIHLTEWNSSPSPRDLVHDTAFMAPFIIENNLRAMSHADTLGFWTFTDVFEENAAGLSVFHGGFGLMNYQGIKKPSYHAYAFLHRLKGDIIAQGEGYIAADDGRTLRALLWNYCHYTQEMQSGKDGVISHYNRYNGVFEEKSVSRELKIELPRGTYKITRFDLDRDNGSAFDLWLKNGAIESLTQEEIKWLKDQSQPESSICIRELNEFDEKITLAPHGVCLIEFQKSENVNSDKKNSARAIKSLRYCPSWRSTNLPFWTG